MPCLRPALLSLVLLCPACSSSDSLPTEAKSVFYQPSGGVCRNERGCFATWNYFVDPDFRVGSNDSRGLENSTHVPI